jgi:hypothetical protein
LKLSSSKQLTEGVKHADEPNPKQQGLKLPLKKYKMNIVDVVVNGGFELTVGIEFLIQCQVVVEV